jgi:low affinity Fe/Cu permease
MGEAIRRALTALGVATASPYAFGVVGIYAIVWAAFGTLEWQGVVTLATWTMTLIIQRAEHRDTQAIHAKLDELLRAKAEARTELAELDAKEPEEIEEIRKREHRRYRKGGSSKPTLVAN